jgi:hypothetical protein
MQSNTMKKTNIVHEFGNLDATLDAQEEHMTYVRRSYMYEFIMLFILAVIVLVITIRNMASDTVTTGGYIICCIIIVMFVIAVIMYVVQLLGANPLAYDEDEGSGSGSGSGSGPVIRIHYV